MIVLNDLLGYKNRMIYQDDKFFKFSLDGVLLANFVDIKLSTKKILDIGTGTGVIPLILSKKTNKKIDAVEIQKELCDLALSSIKYNKLEHQISLFNCDINNFSCDYINKYDIIISNPPYYDGKSCNSSQKNVARNNNNLSLNDLIISSKKILKDKGTLYLVYPSIQMFDLFETLSRHNFIAKKIQFVYHNVNSKSSIFLVKCVKNGKDGMEIIKPLILFDEKGHMTKDYNKIYNGK